MNDRLATHMLVGALIRRAEQAGGAVMVLRKGDPISGTILLQCAEKGLETGLFERVPDYAGGYALMPCGPRPDTYAEAKTQYLDRRRRSDPDIWVVELDIVDAERFAAETIC